MRLGDIYKFVVKEGIKKDPRGVEVVNKLLRDEKRASSKLKGAEKKYYDSERLWNPYSDTRVLYGGLKTEVKKILVGIDMEAPELLMAEELNKQGESIDLVVSHHPEGVALAGLGEVMHMQKAVLVKAGLDPDIAGELLKARIKDVERGIQVANHYRAVDAARLLDMPFMCTHTVSDNQVYSFLQNMINREKPKTAGQVVNLLNKQPEYKDALRRKAGPMLIAGKESNKAGKVLVDMTGGTGGPSNVFARLSQAGIGTIVGMHMSEKSFARVKEERINVIIAGHMASDNIGMNLLLDKLVKSSGIEVITCSGFTRVRR